MRLLILPCAAAMLLLTAAQSAAHEPAPAAPDALVRVAKSEQHRLGIRTQRADAPSAPQLWPARVVADPRSSARVMADQAGVLRAPAGGFPLSGRSVRAGEVLAHLKPSLSDPERRDLEADWEASKRAVALGRLQIQRYSIDEAESLEVRLLTPSIQILLDYRAAQAREAQLAHALAGDVELRAPADGVLLSSSARAGRVVAAGEPIFEISALGSAVLAAQFDDARFDAAAVTRALDRRQTPIAVRLSGSGFDPSTRTQQFLYQTLALEPAQRLVVGDTVRLLVSPRVPAGRYRLPASAVFRRHAQDYVWLHRDAEQFVAQRVHVAQREQDSLQIDAGLTAGQRVVIDAGCLPLQAAASI